MDTFNIGMGLIKIGAGRQSINDIVDPTAGIKLNRKIGDFISAGDELGVIFNSSKRKLDDNIQLFENCMLVDDSVPKPYNLILN